MKIYMANIGEKINLLLQVVPVFGLGSLTKYNYQIFNYKLKEDNNFLSKLDVFKPQIEKIFDVKYEVSNVDQAIKLLKLLLDSCNIQYECGRTSKSSYLKLTEPQNDNNINFQLCGNYLISSPKSEFGTLLIQLVAFSSLFSNKYVCGIESLYPTKWRDDWIEFDHSGRYDYSKYIAVVYNLLSAPLEPIIHNTSIELVSPTTNQIPPKYKQVQQIIVGDKLFVIYEEIMYLYNITDIPIRVTIKNNNLNIRNIEVLSYTCLFDYLPRTTGILEKNSYKSCISKTIDTDQINFLIDGDALGEIKCLKNIWFTNKIVSAKITMNGSSTSYNESQLEFMFLMQLEGSVPASVKSVISFSLDDLGKSCLNVARIDQ